MVEMTTRLTKFIVRVGQSAHKTVLRRRFLRFAVTVVFLIVCSSAWSEQPEDALSEALKLHEAGKPKEALAFYDKAIKANPKSSDAYFNRGNAYYDLNENQHAEIGRASCRERV